MEARDVVVVGAGVIGQSIAWRAAEAGMSVAVIDPDPGRGASWAAAGMLAPVAEAAYREEPLLVANLASHRRWPTFAAELEEASGQRIGYWECGTVMVARDRDDAAELERLLAFREELGLRVRWLRGRELRRAEPSLATGVRAGVECPDDHQVDNRAVVEALRVAGERAGVELVRDSVAELRGSGERVTGVTLSDGTRLEAGAVVVATGAATAAVGGLPGAWRPPVRPVKGQLLHLRVPAGHPPLAERIVRGLEAYVVPRADGRVVVGATVEERGFDVQVTAGGVHHLLREAYELVPGVLECELVEATAGLRPGTPDNAPMIGQGGAEGLWLAAGHYRHGMLLAPLTSEGIVQLLRSGTAPEELAPLAPSRFATAEVSA